MKLSVGGCNTKYPSFWILALSLTALLGGCSNKNLIAETDRASKTDASILDDNSTGVQDSSAGVEVDRNDPARPSAACGQDLDAPNGRVHPDLGRVGHGDEFGGDPLEMGSFLVATSDLKVSNPDPGLNPIPVRFYAPSRDGVELAEGRHPLVLLLPGYGKGLGLLASGLFPTYEFFAKHLVSHGLLVVAMNFIAGGAGIPLVSTEKLGAHFLTAQEKNVDEVRAVLTFVLSESPNRGHIDHSKIAIVGHSQGGKVAFMTATADPRIDVVIGWDPQNAGGGPPCLGAPNTCNRLPVAPICPDPQDPSTSDPGKLFQMRAETLVFAARDAGAMPDRHQWAENFYRGAPSPAHMLLFTRASHESWSDGDNPVARTTMRAQAALLMTRFLGVTGLLPYLPGGATLLEGISDVESHSK